MNTPENTDPSRRMITPRLRNGKRLHFYVSPEDFAKVGRGGDWTATVTNLDTGQKYELRGASCGFPECKCDAIAVPVKEKANAQD